MGSRLLLRLIARGVLGLAFVDGILFGVAGSFAWRGAWVMSVLLAIYLAAGTAFFVRKDPDLLLERMTRASNVPAWDRLLVGLFALCFVALLATAAIDVGRIGWSHMPVGVQAAGALGMLAAFAVIWWCTATNHYLSAQVRLQPERGHRVVRDGPYRFVRHPMYTALIVLMAGMSVLLGSWLALVPAAAIGIVLIVRTSLEDQMLTSLLPGYREYALNVRRRLVPGIW